MQNSELNFGVKLLDSYSSTAVLKQNQIESLNPKCEVKLQQGQLSIKLARSDDRASLLSSRNRQFLTEWLQYCPARLVRLDPALGITAIELWADVCKQTEKAIFLRLPPACQHSKRQNRTNWWLQRLAYRIAAILLLLTLSPVLLGLSLLIYFESSEPIFSRQWCVGERGKLFQTIRFRTTSVNLKLQRDRATGYQQDLNNDIYVTWLGRWMRKYSLDKLPQLLNVVRGEMCFVGPSAYNLNDTVRISSNGCKRLNTLPGIVGA